MEHSTQGRGRFVQKDPNELRRQTDTVLDATHAVGDALDDKSILSSPTQEAAREVIGETTYANYIEEVRSVRRFEQFDEFAKELRAIEAGEQNFAEPLTPEQASAIQERRALYTEKKELHARRLQLQTEISESKQSKSVINPADEKALYGAKSALNKIEGQLKGLRGKLANMGADSPGYATTQERIAQLEAQLPQAQQEVQSAQGVIDAHNQYWDRKIETAIRNVERIEQRMQEIEHLFLESQRRLFQVGLLTEKQLQYAELAYKHRELTDTLAQAKQEQKQVEQDIKKIEKTPEEYSAEVSGGMYRIVEEQQRHIEGVESQIDQNNRQQYEMGMLPLSEYRLRMLGEYEKDIIPNFIHIVQQHVEQQGFAGVLNKHSYKRIAEGHAKLFRSRVKDVLLTAPSEHELQGYIQENLERTARMSAILLSNPYMEKMNEEGITQLFHECLNNNIFPQYKLETIIGYGGSEDPLNVRIPAYIIPGLLNIRRCVAEGIRPPRLKIINGQQLAVTVNQMDRHLVLKHAQETNALLHKFIQQFYPDCKEYVEFDIPNFSFEDPQTRLLFLDHQYLISLQYQSAEELASSPQQVAEIKKVQDALKLLRERGQKHGYESGAALSAVYGAAHVSIFGNIELLSRNDAPNGVIKMGGAGEEAFDTIQHHLTRRHHPQYRGWGSEFFLTNTAGQTKESPGPKPIFATLNVGGNPPAYYSAGKNEMLISLINKSEQEVKTMQDLVGVYKADGELRGALHDVELLRKECGDEYLKFLQGAGIEE